MKPAPLPPEPLSPETPVKFTWHASKLINTSSSSFDQGSANLKGDRLRLYHFLHHDVTQTVVAITIVFNMVVVVAQADHHAENYGDNSAEQDTWMIVADACLLLFYIVELSLRFYVARWKFFRNAFDVLDFVIVTNDLMLGSISWLTSLDTPGWLSFLRIVRLARLLRAYRILIFFPMLASMCRDLVGAMQAVLWGCVLLSFMLTGWAIIAVQVVHPLMKDLVEDGVFNDCARCGRAYSSVMQANLTFLQQVVAGDNWGEVNCPIIEKHPWTAFIFVGVLVSIQLAIMNVILALIVESAEEARRDDLVERINFQEQAFLKKSKKLLTLCEGIDVDGSGDLTLEELLAGFESNKDLVANLKDMGLDQSDIETAFQVMDADGSGSVSYKEFVHYVYKMKTADVHTSLNFIRHFVMQILRMVRDPPDETGRSRRRGSSAISLSPMLSTKTGATDTATDTAANAGGEQVIMQDSLRNSSDASVSQEIVALGPAEADIASGPAGKGDALVIESSAVQSLLQVPAFVTAETAGIKGDTGLEDRLAALLQQVDADLQSMSKKCNDELCTLTSYVSEVSKKMDNQTKLLDSFAATSTSLLGMDSSRQSCGEGLGCRSFPWNPANGASKRV